MPQPPDADPSWPGPLPFIRQGGRVDAMAETRPDPIRPTDAEARSLARRLLNDSRHGALGVLDPESGGPFVSRVATAWEGRAALILVSALSHHSRALMADPRCSLLVGEPGPKGDPLTHPRLSRPSQR